MLITFVLMINILILFLLLFLYSAIKKQQKLLKEQMKVLENFLTANDNDRQNHDRLVDEWKSFVFLQALHIRETISKQVNNLHPKAIEEAPLSHGLTNKELAKSFSPKEIEAIVEFWELFNKYVKEYWKTDQGKIKTVFKGNIDIHGSEVHTIQTVSKQLIPKLDHLIKQMKGVEP